MFIMQENIKNIEEQFIELKQEKERNDRALLNLEVWLGVLFVVIILLPVIAIAYLPIEEEWIKTTIALTGVIPGTLGLFFVLRLEQLVGYYECQKCGHKYIPTYSKTLFAMHFGRTRKMKCPQCGEKSWQKKVV